MGRNKKKHGGGGGAAPQASPATLQHVGAQLDEAAARAKKLDGAATATAAASAEAEAEQLQRAVSTTLASAPVEESGALLERRNTRRGNAPATAAEYFPQLSSSSLVAAPAPAAPPAAEAAPAPAAAARPPDEPPARPETPVAIDKLYLQMDDVVKKAAFKADPPLRPALVRLFAKTFKFPYTEPSGAHAAPSERIVIQDAGAPNSPFYELEDLNDLHEGAVVRLQLLGTSHAPAGTAWAVARRSWLGPTAWSDGSTQ